MTTNNQEIEWVEHHAMMGDDLGSITVWKRGTIMQYLPGWFGTKIVVRVHGILEKNRWVNVTRPYLATMKLSDIANLV